MGADCAVHIIKFLAAHDVTHVTDPFCGKGTVLAAANAFGVSAQGVDLSSKQGAQLQCVTSLLVFSCPCTVKDSQRVVLCASPPLSMCPGPLPHARASPPTPLSAGSHVQALRGGEVRNLR